MWDENACSYAALNVCLEVVNWVRENEWPWDEKNMCICCGERNKPKRARENGCPRDEDACPFMALNTHLEVFQ